MLLESISWSNIKNQLVLEVVDDEDGESGNAGEGGGVVPEAAGLHTPGPGANVDARGAGWGAAEGREITERLGERGRGCGFGAEEVGGETSGEFRERHF